MTLADLISQLAIPGYGDDEVQFIEETLVALRPTCIFEWGTNRGSSARIFHEASNLLGLKTSVYTVELPQELACLDADHPGSQVGHFVRGTCSVHLCEGDGVTVSLGIYRRVKPSRALFFIDGLHSYPNVLRELMWLHRCAPTATLLLHDTSPASGPSRAITDFPGGAFYAAEHLASQAGMTRLTPK